LWVYLLGRFSLMLYFFPAAYPNIYYRALLYKLYLNRLYVKGRNEAEVSLRPFFIPKIPRNSW